MSLSKSDGFMYKSMMIIGEIPPAAQCRFGHVGTAIREKKIAIGRSLDLTARRLVLREGPLGTGTFSRVGILSRL